MTIFRLSENGALTYGMAPWVVALRQRGAPPRISLRSRAQDALRGR
jgi:hypothetical protein